MEFERSKQIKTHLDIAPLIDIIFLLLVFFMLTKNFIMQPGIQIDLPSAMSSKPQKEQNIIVFISKDNEIFLNEQEIDILELKDVLQDRLGKADRKIVILKADEKINLGIAVKVMDIAKVAGSKGVVIATTLQPEEINNGTDQDSN